MGLLRKSGRPIIIAAMFLLLAPAPARPEGHGLPLLSFSLTSPQIASVSLGYAYVMDPLDGSSWAKGVMAQLEPGLAGTKLHAGPLFFGTGSWDGFVWSPKFSVLRTYGDSLWSEGGQTYVGSELEGSFALLWRITGGVYRHASRGDARDWLFSFGVGIGY